MSSTSGVGRFSRIALFVASVVMLGLAAAVFVASSAEAQVVLPAPQSSPCDPYTTTCKPIVKPTLLFNDPDRVRDAELITPPPSLPPSPPPRCVGAKCLPFTGADVTLFAVTGFAAIGTGTVLVRATRSRKARS
jgi:hypothetical protein